MYDVIVRRYVFCVDTHVVTVYGGDNVPSLTDFVLKVIDKLSLSNFHSK